MDKIKLLMELITNLYHEKFFGELLIKMTDGQIVLIKKTESIKI